MADKALQEQGEKVLRIGIVRGGKVVQERLIRPGQNVTIGESPKNTFVIPTAKLPKRHVIFQAKGDRYVLQFTEHMVGKIAYRGGIQGLDELRDKGDATRKGSFHTLVLGPKNRGKIVVDDYTVLFQFVAAPPESARMVSRHDFRPKLLDDDDPVFLGFLALFSALATVLMIYVYNTEPMDTVPLDELPDRFVDIVMPPDDDTPPVEEIKVDDDAESKEVVKKEEEPKDAGEKAKPKKELTPEQRAQQEAARIQKKKENLAKKSKLIAGLIGTRGANNSGDTVVDVFADGDAGIQNLSDALKGVGGIDVADGSNNTGMRGGTDQTGRGDSDIGDLAKASGGEGTVGTGPATKAPSGRANLGAVDLPDGETADKIRSTLRKYSQQVKVCYEQRLKEDPNISGRIAVELAITGGRVSTALIGENSTGDKQLEDCVIGKVKRWRFDADVSEEGIYLPFALSPS